MMFRGGPGLSRYAAGVFARTLYVFDLGATNNHFWFGFHIWVAFCPEEEK